MNRAASFWCGSIHIVNSLIFVSLPMPSDNVAGSGFRHVDQSLVG